MDSNTIKDPYPLEWDALFAIVTPLFLAGADQQQVELRASSLRGALRFWWRALAWSGIATPDEPSVKVKLARIHEIETLLFGFAGSQKNSRQSALSICIEPCPRPGLGSLKKNEKDAILGASKAHGAYYLGYGLMEAFDNQQKNRKAGQLLRPCLESGQGFRVKFRITHPTSLSATLKQDFDTAVSLFEKALHLYGLLGGLGSRARRGWGSLRLHKLSGRTQEFKRADTPESYKAAILDLLPSPLSADEPPYSAFSQRSRIDILIPDTNDAMRVLDEMGRAMQRYRSWGKNGKVNGKPSEKKFRKDHDWSKTYQNKNYNHSTGPYKNYVPARSIFGLPHNYGKIYEKNNRKTLGVKPSEAGKDRRASPLFLHVHQLASDWFIGVSILFTARFLPTDKANVSILNDRRDYTPNWDVLTNFLDSTPANPNHSSYFPDKISVFP
ncbi:type III-B CRISPR module RAMP protein Cmr1 [Insolitispirillum peregrinum]|uniref:type III-B CRISPR module RAMP protein Cmr1 n=1 Tax=Insolitispirillum peregrinum TaxID=80876 RepID=UPI003616D7F5